MTCSPIDPSDVTLPSVPDGFNGGIMPQLPDLDIPFPALPIEDLEELRDLVNIILPPGTLKPNLSATFSKNIMDALLSLLEQFLPILMLYTFFMPILQMILCIIEILCAINNPFKLVKALIRLFRVCIPEFLALFPFFALIMMIISLLLLILTVIIYLIQRIIAFIKQIIQNIEILVEATVSVDTDSIIAITIKLGDILCVFQNVFVILGAIVLIFQIIEKLLKLLFKLPPCDDDDDDDGSGCCTPDVCPSFIKNNKQIDSNSGILQYYNQVNDPDSGEVIRSASYQFFDPDASIPLQFNNITHPYDVPQGVNQTFFPEGNNYTSNTSYKSVPYTVDMRLRYDPVNFGRNDIRGARFIRIKNCIVTKAPVDGVANYDGGLIAPFNGTLFLAGGTAYEDDGVTIMRVLPTDLGAGSLETIINFPAISGNVSSADGIDFEQLEYTFKINHNILIEKSLITLGCHPDVAFNKNFINNAIGTRLNINAEALQNVILPDVQATQDCVIEAIAEFRTNVSIENANKLQDKVLACLDTLRNQTAATLKEVADIGFDPYKSTFDVDPSIQFTTKPIKVVVTLNEGSGTNMVNKFPADVAKSMAENVQAFVTLGKVSTFTYDGVANFVADITSPVAGNGTVKVAYNSQFISVLNNPVDINQLPSITTKELLYTFVQSPAIADTGIVRRDEVDVANEGGGNE